MITSTQGTNLGHLTILFVRVNPTALPRRPNSTTIQQLCEVAPYCTKASMTFWPSFPLLRHPPGSFGPLAHPKIPSLSLDPLRSQKLSALAGSFISAPTPKERQMYQQRLGLKTNGFRVCIARLLRIHLHQYPLTAI